MARGAFQSLGYDAEHGGGSDRGRGRGGERGATERGRGKPDSVPVVRFLAASREEGLSRKREERGGSSTSGAHPRPASSPTSTATVQSIWSSAFRSHTAPTQAGHSSMTGESEDCPLLRTSRTQPAPHGNMPTGQLYGFTSAPLPSRQQTYPQSPSTFYPHSTASVRENQSLLRYHHGPWQTLPEITLNLTMLNAGIQIVDIFTGIKAYGQVESIEIDTNSHGVRTGKARVRMSKVKEAFWLDGTILLLGIPISINLGFRNRKFEVQSPVRKDRVYKEKMGFDAYSLDFGFMYQEKEMMVMYTAGPDHNVRYEVDLYRKCIRIFFDVRFVRDDVTVASSADSGKGDDPSAEEVDVEPPQKSDRVEKFKFEVPFPSLEHFLEQQRTEEENGERSYMIPLPCPPKYYRQLKKWEKSMVPTNGEDHPNYWSINEVWMRQTGIEYDMVTPRTLPVSLKQKKPVIDIGRWTTVRLTFKRQAFERRSFQDMLDALNDFNVCINIAQDITVSTDNRKLTPIWPHIEQDYAQVTAPIDGGCWSDILAQLDKPKIPWSLQYQLEVCVSNNILNEYNLTPEFIERLMKLDEKDAVNLLEHIVIRGVRYFNPFDIFKLRKKDIKRSALYRDVKDYQAALRRATITPTGVIFHSPEVDQTNRVVRAFDRHIDRFIRCSFSDEKNIGRINWSDKRIHNEVFTRVFRTLSRGIEIGDLKFEFLAFGNSQLREHGAWFFAPTDDLNADDIRRWMGKFDEIREVARYASRIGQCFSTTRAINFVKVQLVNIPDVVHNNYKFTDGVGKLSAHLAQMISWEHKLPQVSSCYQFRLGGFKGVLAVDPSIKDQRLVCVRESQRKFDSGHDGLEIIRNSQFCSASLNRQLIIVMSSLGVEDEIFRTRLTNMLSDYEEALVNPRKALEMLTAHIDPNMMTIEVAKLVKEGFFSVREPFVMSLMHLWRAWTSKNLKEKAKIFIDDGAFVLGVVDETATLKGYSFGALQNEQLPEIFIQVSDPGSVVRLAAKDSKATSIEGENGNRIIIGKCVIARNPSLHPGDVRVVNAVYVEALKHHVDVVVFPQKGDRDVPSMLSGGDLDGDDYIVIWDADFTENLMNAEPAAYEPAPKQILDRPVEVEDIQRFFVQYMKNDRLGMIANCHLAWADKSPDGVRSIQCLKLAQLHSDAVDYPKSGVPAKMSAKLKTKYPHFMEKDPDRSYTSHKILGQLYDMVKRVDFVPRYDLDFNPRILNAYELDDEIIEEAKKLKAEYDSDVRRIQAQHDIATEFEIWSTFVMQHGGGRYNDYKFHEDIGRIASALKQRFRQKVYDILMTPEEQIENSKGSTTMHQEKFLRFVAAMYSVTAWEVLYAKELIWKLQNPGKDINAPNAKPLKIGKEEAKRMPPMSFPWVFSDALIRIVKGYDVTFSMVPQKKPPKLRFDLHHDISIEDFKDEGYEILDGMELMNIGEEWAESLGIKTVVDDDKAATEDEYANADVSVGGDGHKEKLNWNDLYDEEGSSGSGDSDAKNEDDDDDDDDQKEDDDESLYSLSVSRSASTAI